MMALTVFIVCPSGVPKSKWLFFMVSLAVGIAIAGGRKGQNLKGPCAKKRVNEGRSSLVCACVYQQWFVLL